MAESTNEERILAELDRRIDAYKRGTPTELDLHAANALQHFRNSIVRPLVNELERWRRAEQEVPQG